MIKKIRIAKMAFTGLGKNKLRTFLMMIGVVIGIAALTIVISAALGARERIVERVMQFGYESLMVHAGGELQMGPRAGTDEITTLRIEDALAIKLELDYVIEAAPFNRIPNQSAVFQQRSTNAPLFGVDPGWSTVWNWNVTSGDFISESDLEHLNRVCVIGTTVKQELFGDSNPVGEIIRVGNAPFEVIGVMQSRGISAGGSDMDNRIFIPLSTFMRRVANVDHIYAIRILLSSAADVDRAVHEITALLRERHRLAPGVPNDFSIRSAEEVQIMVEGMLGTFNLFLILVAGISLLTSGVVVANIMLISVNERRKEIGLRKALGASNKDISSQFILEAAAVTLTGGLFGIIAGAAGAFVLELITQTPIAISWEIVAVGVFFSAITGIIAGLQPAKRAAAVSPIESLQG